MKTEFKLKQDGTMAWSVVDNFAPDTLTIGCDWPNIKSHLKVGNMVINNTRRFNWFERKMWKLFFGFDIENVKEN